MNDSISKSLFKKFIPIKGLFDLTYHCNLRCQHCCIVGENREELALQEVKCIIDQLFEMKTFILLFSGGEPLIRSDITDILSYARKLNFRVELFTNGTLLDRNLAREFAGIGVNNISVSLYGVSDKVHDEVTGVDGSYEATVRAIHILRECGINITVKSSIISTNFEEADDLYKWSSKAGIFHQFSCVIVPMLNGSKDNIKSLSEDQVRAFLKKPWVRQHAASSMVEQQNDRICSAGVTSFNISPYGDVFPCPYLRISCGNTREVNFSESWNSPSMRYIRKISLDDLDACSKCELAKKCCNICIGQAWLENGTFLEPSSSRCQYSKILNETYIEDAII